MIAPARTPTRGRHTGWLVHVFLCGCVLLAACAPTREATKSAWPGPFVVPPTPRELSQPIVFPRDEGPHDVLTEWWYYTGHLRTDDGREFGFESVLFQSRRGTFPAFYAAHVAFTDIARSAFVFDQRAGTVVSTTEPGFDFALGDWRWQGLAGNDRIDAGAGPYAASLTLAATKPPVLHNGGFIDFDAAGSTYYYSRTRMSVSGSLIDRGQRVTVTGEAWFDHQWGNFLGSATGGWDWFSAQLSDGSEFTLSVLRSDGQRVVGGYGTYVDPLGNAVHLDFAAMSVRVLEHWTSPTTRVTYPSGWRVILPLQGLDLRITPVLHDQELDTRATTGNIYWEGAMRVTDASTSSPRGRGYVELTGYDQR